MTKSAKILNISKSMCVLVLFINLDKAPELSHAAKLTAPLSNRFYRRAFWGFPSVSLVHTTHACMQAYLAHALSAVRNWLESRQLPPSQTPRAIIRGAASPPKQVRQATNSGKKSVNKNRSYFYLGFIFFATKFSTNSQLDKSWVRKVER